MLLQKIQDLAKAQFEKTQQDRHHLHMHPELSFEEHQTAKYVAERLRQMGLEPQEGVAGTGLVATIRGGKSDGRTVALRADMDALPITEANNVPYKSKNEGVMHACGHDVHTSSLLGAAEILMQVREDLPGDVKLIFQPGEERVPGGASIMIKEGVLQNPNPRSIIGQHVMPYLPAGKIGFRGGMYMASADELYFTVKGKGGHAAVPENFTDPVIATAQILVALQQVVSRMGSPKIPSVLSFGNIETPGGATNIIPNEVHVAGTFRTLNEDWRAEAKKHIQRVAEHTAAAFGCTVDVEIRHGYPYLSNDPSLTQHLQEAARAYMGEENVVDLDLWMAAEDFAFYSHEVPACFYRLGTGNEAKGITSGVHTPTFDIDEEALRHSTGLMAWLAVAEMEL